MVSFFVFYHCDEPISFPFVCLPVWLFPVLEPFSFPVFDYLSLVFEIIVIPRFSYSCSDLLDLLWCYFVQGSKYFRVELVGCFIKVVGIKYCSIVEYFGKLLYFVVSEAANLFCLSFGLWVWECCVLSVMILWSDMYGPGTRDPV